MFITSHMTRQPVTIAAGTPLPEARQLLLAGGFRHLPVTDAEGRLLGIVTDRDLRSALPSTFLSGENAEAGLTEFAHTPVSAIMSPPRFALDRLATLDDALIILDREGIGALPVVDEEQRVVGIFSIRDLMAAYRRIFALGQRGSAMVVVEDDGKRKPLSRIARTLEEREIRFTRLIRTEAEGERPARIYLRVNTMNISSVHHALEEAGFTVVRPEGLPC
jgi:acetoin utilization protein AcuB